jgi:hypothetical protein
VTEKENSGVAGMSVLGDPNSPPSTPKPLFIPLKAEYFDAFCSGHKREELRVYGPRWNERTCAPGRRVILSRGYGKRARLSGVIWKFKRQHASTFGSTYRQSIERIYGTLDMLIACISIDVESVSQGETHA